MTTTQNTRLKAPLSPLSQLLYVPFWWYTAGLAWFGQKVLSFINNKRRSLNIGVWVRYLFVPMYGEKDTIGRLISFFIRFFQIIFRTFALAFYLLISFLVLLVWLIFPGLILYLLIRLVV